MVYRPSNVGNHHIVINTNQKITNNKTSRALVRKFTRIINDVFSEKNLGNIIRIFKCSNPDPIHSFCMHTAIEWSSTRQKRLHAHVLIFTVYDYDCNMRIAYDFLRCKIEHRLSMPIYFKGNLLPKKQTMEEMLENQRNYLLKEKIRIETE